MGPKQFQNLTTGAFGGGGGPTGPGLPTPAPPEHPHGPEASAPRLVSHCVWRPGGSSILPAETARPPLKIRLQLPNR